MRYTYSQSHTFFLIGNKTLLWMVVLCSALILVMASNVFAHGQVHQQIEQINQLLVDNPDDTRLLLKRGRLHHEQRHWDQALTDYDQVLSLDKTLSQVYFLRGRVLLDAGRYQQADQQLSRYLSLYPAHPQSNIMRGRTRVKQGRYAAAAQDYAAAQRHVSIQIPDIVIEHVQALIRAGDDYFSEASQRLAAAIKTLGPLVVLQLKAIELDRLRGDHQSALDTIDGLIIRSTRKEKWQLMRGELLLEIGEPILAKQTLFDAKQSITRLPQKQRQTRAMRALLKQVNLTMEKLTSK